MTVNYELGSGISDETLPDLVQEPDCQLELTGKKLIGSGEQDLSSTIIFNEDQSSVLVESAEYDL